MNKKQAKRLPGAEDDGCDSSETRQKKRHQREESFVDTQRHPGINRVNQRKHQSSDDLDETRHPDDYQDGNGSRKPQLGSHRVNQDSEGKHRPQKGRNAWAEDSEDYNDNYSTTKPRGSSKHSRQKPKGRGNEFMRLNLGLSEEEDEDDFGLRHRYRSNDTDTRDDDRWGEGKASRKQSNKHKKSSRSASEGADWMSPRRPSEKRRPHTESDWQSSATAGSRTKKGKPDISGKKWAKAPAGTDVTGVSMLHPKPPKSNKTSTRNKTGTMVKAYEVGCSLISLTKCTLEHTKTRLLYISTTLSAPSLHGYFPVVL